MTVASYAEQSLRELEEWIGGMQGPRPETEPAGTFDEAALQAVTSWVFKPAMRNGEPQAERGRQSKVTFKLEKGLHGRASQASTDFDPGDPALKKCYWYAGPRPGEGWKTVATSLHYNRFLRPS